MMVAYSLQNAIITALPKLPYGLRYISMKLKQDLQEKFHDIPEEEVIKVGLINCTAACGLLISFKVVGNLLYYRYVNPAIIAPEAFEVIEVAKNQEVA